MLKRKDFNSFYGGTQSDLNRISRNCCYVACLVNDDPEHRDTTFVLEKIKEALKKGFITETMWVLDPVSVYNLTHKVKASVRADVANIKVRDFKMSYLDGSLAVFGCLTNPTCATETHFVELKIDADGYEIFHDPWRNSKASQSFELTSLRILYKEGAKNPLNNRG